MVVTACEASIAEELISVGRQTTAVMYRLVKLCASFDSSTEWVLAGLPTGAHWIATNMDVELSTAREWIRIGKTLEHLPLSDQAFADQRLSFSKIRTLTRVAKPENEEELLAIAQSVPAARFKHALAAWSIKNEDPKDIDERQQRDRGVFVSTEPDGSLLAIVRLPTLDGGKLLAAIDGNMTTNHSRLGATAVAPTLAQQRADALIRLISSGASKKVETEVIVHVRGDGCSLDDGTPVPESVVERIAPSSFIRALIHDAQGRPINASGRRRHPTDRQKRVVKERDRHCVDCGSNAFEQYDHVPDYNITKRTVVDELFLRCSRCHARRHEADAA